MKYMGSKNRIAKHILPIMLAERKPNQTWVEPFVGGANIIDKVTGPRIGADANIHLIQALIAIRDNLTELPKNNKEFTEQDYKNINNYKYKGYAGFAFSFGAKWMCGWRRDKDNKRDYVKEAYKNAAKQSPALQNVKLIHTSYTELNIPNNSIIYCDPPYQGTKKYNTKDFWHHGFWEWCRQKAQNHTLYISEYNAPKDFTCIWEKEIVSSLTKNTGSKTGIERLFKYTGGYKC